MEQEKELVRRAQNDPQAFGIIFDLYYEKIYRYSLRRTGDTGLAEDITAATFYKAMKALWRFVWRDISLSSWIYKIATNEIRKHYRALGKTVSLDDNFDMVSIIAASDLKEELIDAEIEFETQRDLKVLRDALNALPLRYREALYLRFIEGKKIHEISEILGKREGTVKSLLSRGIGLLRERTLQPNGEPGIISSEG